MHRNCSPVHCHLLTQSNDRLDAISCDGRGLGPGRPSLATSPRHSGVAIARHYGGCGNAQEKLKTSLEVYQSDEELSPDEGLEVDKLY